MANKLCSCTQVDLSTSALIRGMKKNDWAYTRQVWSSNKKHNNVKSQLFQNINSSFVNPTQTEISCIWTLFIRFMLVGLYTSDLIFRKVYLQDKNNRLPKRVDFHTQVSLSKTEFICRVLRYVNKWKSKKNQINNSTETIIVL